VNLLTGQTLQAIHALILSEIANRSLHSR
jgi:hypothetical protein